MKKLPTEIWIADDDLHALLSYESALNHLQNTLPVTYFRNGYGMLTDLITRPSEFCCFLIIDSRMPVLDGLGTIRQLAERDLLKEHYVTFISTRPAKGEQEYVKKLGLSFFEQPEEFTGVIKILQMILAPPVL